MIAIFLTVVLLYYVLAIVCETVKVVFVSIYMDVREKGKTCPRVTVHLVDNSLLGFGVTESSFYAVCSLVQFVVFSRQLN